MTSRASLGLALFSLLGVGCARSGNLKAVHVDEPGTHVVSSHGTISVVRNSGNASRVCTTLVPGKSGRGSARPPAGAKLDVFLFRLCEARANGDISAEQYAASVQSIVKSMEQVAARPHVARQPRMQFDGQPQRPWRKRGGRFDGQRRRQNLDDSEPGPPRPEPKKDAPK